MVMVLLVVRMTFVNCRVDISASKYFPTNNRRECVARAGRFDPVRSVYKADQRLLSLVPRLFLCESSLNHLARLGRNGVWIRREIHSCGLLDQVAFQVIVG